MLITVHSFAQSLIPFEFTSEDENRLLKENDSFKYYVASGDTMNTVGINEEGQYYKLLNKDLKLIAAGTFIMEGEKANVLVSFTLTPENPGLIQEYEISLVERK